MEKSAENPQKEGPILVLLFLDHDKVKFGLNRLDCLRYASKFKHDNYDGLQGAENQIIEGHEKGEKHAVTTVPAKDLESEI